jgi:hypothetical protein
MSSMMACSRANVSAWRNSVSASWMRSRRIRIRRAIQTATATGRMSRATVRMVANTADGHGAAVDRAMTYSMDGTTQAQSAPHRRTGGRARHRHDPRVERPAAAGGRRGAGQQAPLAHRQCGQHEQFDCVSPDRAQGIQAARRPLMPKACRTGTRPSPPADCPGEAGRAVLVPTPPNGLTWAPPRAARGDEWT